jgi:hypothetical protein
MQCVDMNIETPVAISLLAFAVSIASLTVSLFSYLRDRSKLRVWSNIVWQFNGSEPETPVMHVFIANTGRRPVVILNFVKRAGRRKWWRTIQRPMLDVDVINSIEQIQELKKKSLAQHAAIKLGEGEIFELTFHSDNLQEFIATHDDDPIEATNIQIEDVTGKLYSVKDAKKNLVSLYKACNTNV